MNSEEIKSAREIEDLIGIVRREQLRTQVLVILDEAYPKRLPVLRIWGVLQKKNRDASLSDMNVEATYLQEKALVTIDAQNQVRITARGRDFLDGHIEEPGLAESGLFR